MAKSHRAVQPRRRRHRQTLLHPLIPATGYGRGIRERWIVCLPIFLLRPSTLPANHVPSDIFGKDRYSARGKTLKELITVVWSQKNSGLKIKYDANLPEGTFDFIVAGQSHWWNQLQSEIDRRFHLVERIETGETGETSDTVVVRNSDTP